MKFNLATWIASGLENTKEKKERSFKYSIFQSLLNNVAAIFNVLVQKYDLSSVEEQTILIYPLQQLFSEQIF
jgi:hypothetical protein